VTTLREPPAETLVGMNEVARISTPIDDESLEHFIAWAENTYGQSLVAHGDASWLTFYAPAN